MSLLEIAKQYRDAGLSVIGSSKKGSVIDWKKYQTDNAQYLCRKSFLNLSEHKEV